jgi:glycosyltransferase involved in cell wall biosynthesis
MAASAETRPRPVRVGVLVDLGRRPQASGHVNFWERVAAAAAEMPGALDLTVHFSGARAEVDVLAEHVRLRTHRPRFSSGRLRFLSHVPDHTDLAPFHPGLAAHLGDVDVVHTTDAYFAFARTAERLAQRRRIPLVTSVHTDTPRYARFYTAATVERLWGSAWPARLLLERLGAPARAEQRLARRLLRHQQRCAFTLLAGRAQLEATARALPRERLGILRRGIDHVLFSPAARDRAWLEARLGVAPDRLALLFVGRLDRGKNVTVLVDAVEALVEEGVRLTLVCAGEGPERAEIARRLPREAAICPGALPPETLARVYASCDLLAQPSEVEECSHVVLEALSSGLPVLAAAGGGGRLLVDGETGLVIRGGGAAAWVEVLRALAGDPDRRRALAATARRWAEQAVPSWTAVLLEDLLPRWRRAAEGRGA